MADPIEESARGEPTLPTQSAAFGETEQLASSTDLLEADEARRAAATRISSPSRDAVRRFMRNWAAVLSVAVVAVLIVMSIFAKYMHTTDPTALDYNALSQGPSPAHWFGTDTEGRDEYTRILYGLRVPFVVSFVGTFLTVVLGMLFGLVAGLYGGRVDSLVSRFTDFMFAFPAFLLTIIIVTLYGGWFDQNFPNGEGRAIILTAVFALVSWPPLMRFVRSLALSLKEQQFIEAARTSGTTNWRIITRHLVPNVWGLVLVQGALTVAYIIGTEAVLSILGQGVNEPNPDLGTMLYDGAKYMYTNGWLAFFPSLFLTILILAFTFIGDGIRDAVDPRMNQ
ncbi:MAG TPA: ABC transporter permease [Chloroflexota bacterium]